MAAARVKLADKMVMLPPLFDGTKSEVVIGEAIELFEHTLDTKALVWFQEHKDKFVGLTTLKTMFLQRYNPWRKIK